MWESTRPRVDQQLHEIRDGGAFKAERILSTAQGVRIRVGEGDPVLNLCANNYLGLSNHPEIVRAAHAGLDNWGYGLSSVRFICGAQEPHKLLEARISEFLGTEDTILYSSCFDANAGLFETLLGPEDAVISDALNHASIIDGIRLSKAARFRYRNNDMADLEEQLVNAQAARTRLIATDGVFSMDGVIANLAGICSLAEKYNALVMVDDSHAVGFMGRRGRGSHEHCGVMGRVDILTGTLGKALGGASGGYTSGPKELIELLRQRSRPYLFSNSLAPPIVAASLRALELLTESTQIARSAFREHSLLPRRRLAGWPRGDARRAPDCPGDAGRRRGRPRHGRRASNQRRLRDRLFLSPWCQKVKREFVCRSPPPTAGKIWSSCSKSWPRRLPKRGLEPVKAKQSIAHGPRTIRPQRRDRRGARIRAVQLIDAVNYFHTDPTTP